MSDVLDISPVAIVSNGIPLGEMTREQLMDALIELSTRYRRAKAQIEVYERFKA